MYPSCLISIYYAHNLIPPPPAIVFYPFVTLGTVRTNYVIYNLVDITI